MNNKRLSNPTYGWTQPTSNFVSHYPVFPVDVRNTVTSETFYIATTDLNLSQTADLKYSPHVGVTTWIGRQIAVEVNSARTEAWYHVKQNVGGPIRNNIRPTCDRFCQMLYIGLTILFSQPNCKLSLTNNALFALLVSV